MAERSSTGASRWVLLITAIIALGAYTLQFHHHCFSSDPAEWGQFGDYLGGILNPIVAFGAFLWLVASVKFQKEELAATKTALEKSQSAQQQQADTSLLTAQINTFNIQLSRVSGKIQELRTKQLYISELQNRLDHPTHYIDEHDERHHVTTVAAKIAREIGTLETESDRIADEVKVISSQYRKKVDTSYSN